MPLPVKKPTSLAGYLEAMTRAAFSASISFKVIDARWPGTIEAFDHFDPKKVAAYTPDDVDRLMEDTRIVRNRGKVEGTVHNAGEMINVQRQFGGMEAYFASFPDSDALAADLHKRFKYMGETSARMFLYAVAWDLPAQTAWATAHFGEEKMREHGH